MRNTTFLNRLHVRNSVRIIEVSDNRGTDNRGRTVHVKLAACQVRDSSVTQPTPIIITQDCSTGALPHKGQKRPLSWHHTRYANIIISISEANNKCRARKLNILVPNTRARVQIIRSANCTAKSKQKKQKAQKKKQWQAKGTANNENIRHTAIESTKQAERLGTRLSAPVERHSSRDTHCRKTTKEQLMKRGHHCPSVWHALADA